MEGVGGIKGEIFYQTSSTTTDKQLHGKITTEGLVVSLV